MGIPRLGLAAGLVAAWLLSTSVPLRAYAVEPSAALVREEESARKKCAAELLKLARWCALQKGYDAALVEIERGLTVLPDDPRLLAEQKRLAGKSSDPRGGFDARLEARRETTHARCVKTLADVARRYDTADLGAPFDALLDSARSSFPGAGLGDAFGLVYFEPYLSWVRKADAARLAAGGEQVDGVWLTAEEVAEANARHATWDDPWKVADRRHEVRTVMPLRTAKAVLAHVGATREFMLEYFAGEWDLREPRGLLPVVLTETRAELVARAEAETGRVGGTPTSAAFYMGSTGDLNPCFLTFEPMMANGEVVKIDFEELLFPLKHEVAHQVAFEYSKHRADRSRVTTHHFWSVEALANFIPFFVVGKDGWKLTRPKTVPMAGGGMPGAFAWTQKNLGTVEPLAALMKRPQILLDVDAYHHCATVAYFLLEGNDRVHRPAFLNFLADIHACRDTIDLWTKHFPETPVERLQESFDTFVRELEIEGATRE